MYTNVLDIRQYIFTRRHVKKKTELRQGKGDALKDALCKVEAFVIKPVVTWVLAETLEALMDRRAGRTNGRRSEV
jgi:hypothetical protein